MFSTFTVPGSQETRAYGISNSGQIVGTYYDGTTTHGFLATATSAVVPEPASFALVAAGLGIVGGVARRRTHASA